MTDEDLGDSTEDQGLFGGSVLYGFVINVVLISLGVIEQKGGDCFGCPGYYF